MEIVFYILLIALLPTIFLPRIDVYVHTDSKKYLDMSQEERYTLFTEGGRPVVYLEYAGKLRRNARPKNLRREWESLTYTFVYYCPVMDLALEKVIIKFKDNEPVIFSGKDLYIHFPRNGAGRFSSTFEGDIYVPIYSIMAETYIKYDVEYIQLISTDSSPCQLNTRLEGFEKDTIENWAA